MRPFIALIHKDAGSDFGVSFPDLPGCVTAGKTLDEARAFATEALALHLEGLAEDEEVVPEPSGIEAIMAERQNRDAIAFLVEAPKSVSKSVRINITLPADVLDEIDQYAEAQGLSRSGFLARAAKREMAA
ncbi:MAG: type II toxin-antitoxin system HicB family antitoxin [Hyphomicrobium sp.]